MSPSLVISLSVALGFLLAPLGFVMGTSVYSMSLTLEDHVQGSMLDRVIGKAVFATLGTLTGLLGPFLVAKVYYWSLTWSGF